MHGAMEVDPWVVSVSEAMSSPFVESLSLCVRCSLLVVGHCFGKPLVQWLDSGLLVDVPCRSPTRDSESFS